MSNTTVASSEFFQGYGRGGCGVTKQFKGAIPLQTLRNEMFAWEVNEVPLFAKIQGQDVEIPGKKALVRSDASVVLGTPSKKYQPHQYQHSLLDGLSKILGDGLAIDGAGYTGYGAKAWVSVSLADTVTTAEGVEFLPRLFALGSHDSTIASTYKRGTLLMICNNMLGALHRNHEGREAGFAEVRVRHTANSMLHLESAQEALGILGQVEDEFSRSVKALCEQEVTRKQFDALVAEYVAMPTEAGRGRTLAESKREGLTAMYLNDPRCAQWQGTSWGVVQSINTYERWVATVRGAERHERNAERDMTDFWDTLDNNTISLLDRVRVTA